jgi:hypothetical protein
LENNLNLAKKYMYRKNVQSVVFQELEVLGIENKCLCKPNEQRRNKIVQMSHLRSLCAGRGV